jgi:hypothetical protein
MAYFMEGNNENITSSSGIKYANTHWFLVCCDIIWKNLVYVCLNCVTDCQHGVSWSRWLAGVFKFFRDQTELTSACIGFSHTENPSTVLSLLADLKECLKCASPIAKYLSWYSLPFPRLLLIWWLGYGLNGREIEVDSRLEASDFSLLYNVRPALLRNLYILQCTAYRG